MFTLMALLFASSPALQDGCCEDEPQGSQGHVWHCGACQAGSHRTEYGVDCRTNPSFPHCRRCPGGRFERCVPWQLRGWTCLRNARNASSAFRKRQQQTEIQHMRLFYRSNDAARMQALEKVLRYENLWAQTIGIPGIRLLERHSAKEVTNAAARVLLTSKFCQRQLKRTQSNATDPVCSEATPLCCIHAWWTDDPATRQLNIFASPTNCGHIDVYSPTQSVEASPTFCAGSPSNWLSQMAMLQRVAKAHQIEPGYWILLEDDAHPTADWRTDLRHFFEEHPPCRWDIARLSGQVPGLFQGTAAYMIHSSYAQQMHALLATEPIGSVDVMLTALAGGNYTPRSLMIPPRQVFSTRPVFSPVPHRFATTLSSAGVSTTPASPPPLQPQKRTERGMQRQRGMQRHDSAAHTRDQLNDSAMDSCTESTLDRRAISFSQQLVRLLLLPLMHLKRFNATTLTAVQGPDQSAALHACTGGLQLLDTGWPVCQEDLRTLGAQSVCLIYTVGIGNDWRFEDRMARHGCEVHSFDPTEHLLQSHHAHTQPGVSFHPWGLHGAEGCRAVAENRSFYGALHGPMLTLKQILGRLGHANRKLHVLKIDCEGCEWDVFDHLRRSQPALLSRVKLLLLELHLGGTILKMATDGDVARAASLYFHVFKQHGFCVYFHRINPVGETFRNYHPVLRDAGAAAGRPSYEIGLRRCAEPERTI